MPRKSKEPGTKASRKAHEQGPVSKRVLEPIDGPELIIGLIGAVGTDLQVVTDVLKKELVEVGYSSECIRLSELLQEFNQSTTVVDDLHEDDRIRRLMRAGNELRQVVARGDAMALLAISAIGRRREELGGLSNVARPKTAFILSSLKHPHEVDTLRRVYGKAFLGISVYSPRLERIEFLAERIARTYHGFNKEFHRKDAELLVEEDASSGTKETGQNVREAFPLADVFIRMSRRQEVREQLSRVIRILFSYPFHTPSHDEFGMFHAKSTALRSADLSRQVGAVVISADGDLLCVGCNEVPRAGGGSVWEGDPNDYRDFQIGHDSSATLKDEIVGEVIDALKHGDWLSSKKSKIPTSELVEEALYQGGRVLKPTRVTSILEFGRIVHAEMNALMDAARRGVSVKGATLYCTTFPCHMCARHIIASGIKRVVFIEPYPKSMARDLYKRAVRVEEGSADKEAVSFDSFVGVSPRRYIDFFEMQGERKDHRGQAVDWNKAKSRPRFERLVETYLFVERKIVEALDELLPDKLNFNKPREHQ